MMPDNKPEENVADEDQFTYSPGQSSPEEDEMQKVNRAVMGIFEVLEKQSKILENQQMTINSLTNTVGHLTNCIEALAERRK
jgi:hypothetical protein